VLIGRERLHRAQTREKFATQVNSEILAAVRALAKKEGRQLQALVDEAFVDLSENRKYATSRARVLGSMARGIWDWSKLFAAIAVSTTGLSHSLY
jgi:hypothetical protein